MAEFESVVAEMEQIVASGALDGQLQRAREGGCLTPRAKGVPFRARRGISVQRNGVSLKPRDFLAILPEHRSARVDRAPAQFLLDPQELVVLGDAVDPRRARRS